MKFSDRTGWDRHSNALTHLLDHLKTTGSDVMDLTESNPTRCGFNYPKDLLKGLTDPENLVYEPESRGMLPAREAVGEFVQFPADRIMLTASTSESYLYLFRLLLNPGDKVLVPKPSYPLFQFLLEINDAAVDQYPLVYKDEWRIDFKALERLIDRRTKAIILVNPNNPTGSYLKEDELETLNAICRKHGLAVISDEVFFHYRLSDGPFVSLKDNAEILTFTLGGLSKGLGLPQMKLGWILANGPADVVEEALSRLEIIADTFLSVNTPVQNATTWWFKHCLPVRDQILERITINLDVVKSTGLDVCTVEGGWYAVIRLPGIDEEKFVLDLLKTHQILAHPGFFFDFEKPGHLIVSLLPKTGQFAKMIATIKEFAHA